MRSGERTLPIGRSSNDAVIFGVFLGRYVLSIWTVQGKIGGIDRMADPERLGRFELKILDEDGAYGQ